MGSSWPARAGSTGARPAGSTRSGAAWTGAARSGAAGLALPSGTVESPFAPVSTGIAVSGRHSGINGHNGINGHSRLPGRAGPAAAPASGPLTARGATRHPGWLLLVSTLGPGGVVRSGHGGRAVTIGTPAVPPTLPVAVVLPIPVALAVGPLSPRTG